MYRCPQLTPMILTLKVNYNRASDLAKPDYLLVQPSVPVGRFLSSSIRVRRMKPARLLSGTANDPRPWALPRSPSAPVPG